MGVLQQRDKIIEKLHLYFTKAPVEKVYLFGSLARNTHDDKSDIDLYLSFKPTFAPTLFDLIGIKIDLESLTGRRVDVVQQGTEYEHIKESLENDMLLIYGQEK